MNRRSALLVTAAVPVAALVAPTPAAAEPPTTGGGGPGDPTQIRPSLTVSFEPIEGSDAVYLPLAPGTADESASAKLVLRLKLTNAGATNLTITSISFAFPGSGVATEPMEGEQIVLKDGGVLVPAETKYWSNGKVTLGDGSKVANQVYLPLPMPTTVQVRVFAAGYPAPVLVDAPLAPYQIAHRLPFDLADLRTAECIHARGDHGTNGGAGGSQIYAHDIGVLGWDYGTHDWEKLLPGKDASKNEHFRAWDLPIRAVAAGTVYAMSDGMDDNPVPGVAPSPAPSPKGGNYVWLEHPDGTRTYYAHFRKGTVAVQLGDSVIAGQILGRLGNSGNSSGPHLHLEVRNHATGSLRPWAVTSAWMIEKGAGTPWNPNSNQWVAAGNRGIPNESMLVWPSHNRPRSYIFKLRDFIEVDFPPHQWWTFVDEAAKHGYEPALFGAVTVGDRVFAHSLFRLARDAPRQARSGLTAGEYATEMAALEKEGYRPVTVATYLDDGVRYAGVWTRETGPEWTSYHGVDVESHRKRLGELATKGFVPVDISMVLVKGVAEVTARYVRSSVDTAAPVLLSLSELDAAVAANARAGRHLVHLAATQISEKEARFSAIFKANASPKKIVQLDRAGLIDEVRRRAEAKQTVAVIAGFVQDNEVSFLAAWAE